MKASSATIEEKCILSIIDMKNVCMKLAVSKYSLKEMMISSKFCQMFIKSERRMKLKNIFFLGMCFFLNLK